MISEMDCTLKPKGTEADYSGWVDIIGNGHTVPGLKMAPKTFIIISIVGLGKPYTPLINIGRSLVRGNDGAEGRGSGKKRKAACNERYRGLKHDLNLKRC